MNAIVSPRIKERLGDVKLNSHDVNVISAIVQQKGRLPSDYLVQFARESQISGDSLDIVILVLADEDEGARGMQFREKKQEIAEQYKNWIHSFQSRP